jgi:hypothetical protein
MLYLDLNNNTPQETDRELASDTGDRIVLIASNYQGPGFIKIILPALLLVLTAFFAGPVLAEKNPGSQWLGKLKSLNAEETYVYTSLYTTHYDPEPDHVNDQNMLGFENGLGGVRLWGLAIFDNSFGQESQYLYLGQKWRAFESDQWYYKLTAGLLHGYKEPYDDKIPLNDLGVAPAIVPALGYRKKSFFAEFSQLGLAAGLITVGVAF